MNRLVAKTNDRITEVVTKFSPHAYTANWNGYAIAMGGQFCKSDSAPVFSDVSNHGLAFIRPNIGQHFSIPGEKRDLGYGWKREVVLPDEILRNFHPTQLGTYMQANTALDYVALHKAKADGTNNPDHATSCEYKPPAPPTGPPKDELRCSDNAGAGARRYLSRDGLVKNIEDFCKDIDGAKTNQQKEYRADTYDGAKLFFVTPGAAIKKDKCIEKMKVIADACSGTPKGDNPMNWKYGGSLDSEGFTFEISPWGKRTMARKADDKNKPLQKPIAKCDSFYQAFNDEFWIYGAGFANGDFGADLLAQMKHCVGGGVTKWTFDYYDEPDKDGMEWKAFGHTPIWQKNCFSAVIKGAGGPDVPCNGKG
jgi:hypothetical protein